MVQYYTLEQAAKVLQTTPEKVKEMAKKNEVRAFQDRGNLRFRAPEIDEVARSRGIGSNPELPLGEAPKSAPPKSASPSPQPKRKSKIPPQEPIAFVEDDEAPIGRETSVPGKGGSPSSRQTGSASKVGRKPTMAQTSGPKSPPPKAASDSDVRLVAEGSNLDFQVVPEAPKSPPPGAKSGARKTPGSSKTGKSPDPADSGVRIVPLEDASDSDVKLESQSGVGESALAGPGSAKKPSDSDIRLDPSTREITGKSKRDEHPITEEIDLDEETKRADAGRPAPAKTRPKPNPLNLPTSSPFELSEADIDVDEPPTRKPRPGKPTEKKAETDSSADFELTPGAGGDQSPLELGSSEVEAIQGDDSDEVSLGELTGAGAAQSGINLQDPADSGISLEQGGSDEIEFELSLDSGATPKPGPVSPEESSSEFELATEGAESSPAEESSEFELALDSADAPAGEEESSSEFELSLDVEGSSETEAAEAEPDSDSEFELTLDADGGLESSDEADALSGGEDEKDIFETDFEVPALEEESGSEAVALEDEDTDLETSDFDLALEEGAESEEEDAESGSQVVALEEGEEADEGAETKARPRRRPRPAAADEDEESELDLEIDPNAEPEEEEEEEAVASTAAAAPAAPWGPLPALLLIPSVVVMFFVGLLAFELAGSMWSYRQPGRTTGFGIVLHPIAKYFDNTLPD